MNKSNKFILVTALSLPLLLSGCQTTRQNAATGEQETNRTTSGALLGCAGGAIAGAIINKGKGAAIGCAAGGATGALVGSNMDKQEAELRQELLNSGVQIERNGERIELIIASDISFNSGGYDLQPSIKPTLDSIAKVMNRYPESNLLIEGHTDSTGSLELNELLAKARANSVQTALTSSGLEYNRTRTQGFGPHKPMCDNATPEGRACNRRVELTIIN
ncbi:OmpA family protein [Vibrio astriarenae]|uniref:OmpA family protein n=1 Tax=Vibrio agarivorans TaxID=153622 RepID=A0ABT7Y5L3_9VIBR|nr:OmpA family protein [Vibrio agarivorans]MDN2483322.1 OmpA family protein [Vibrio agarivorans]